MEENIAKKQAQICKEINDVSEVFDPHWVHVGLQHKSSFEGGLSCDRFYVENPSTSLLAY